MTLTRKDLIKKSQAKPLYKLGWEDLRGTMREFSQADVVIVRDGDRARIMKDRQGRYSQIPRYENGLVNARDLT